VRETDSERVSAIPNMRSRAATALSFYSASALHYAALHCTALHCPYHVLL
jgi:hypothetical protein